MRQQPKGLLARDHKVESDEGLTLQTLDPLDIYPIVNFKIPKLVKRDAIKLAWTPSYIKST